MRALVQRVSEASVTIAGEMVAEIGAGLCVLVGVTHGDGEDQADKLAQKLARLRIFPDEEQKMNRSVLDVGGAVLVVSQFTLYADTRSGNRPGYAAAALPEVAEPLIGRLVERLTEVGLAVGTGRFGADMDVRIVNRGPVTITLDVDAPGR